MPKYHLDCGNSSEGPIGLCAVIEAKDAEEALAKLKAILPDEIDIRDECFSGSFDRFGDVGDVEYVNVYISAENIKITELDEEDES